MTVSSAAAWLRQTSTIVGIATICGAVAGLAAGQISWAEAAPAVVGALVAMGLPGHPDVSASVAKVAADVAELKSLTTRTAAITALGADVPAAIDAAAGAVPAGAAGATGAQS